MKPTVYESRNKADMAILASSSRGLWLHETGNPNIPGWSVLTLLVQREIMSPLSFNIFSSDKDLIAKIDIDDAF